MYSRPPWDEYFLKLADLVSSRSTCLRRHVGAVLVKNDRIIATGYNGAPKGIKHCLDTGCFREQQGIPSGQRYELCRGVHAEQNVIINAAYYGVSTQGTELYCTDQPCIICARMIINAGITRVVYRGSFADQLALDFMKEAGIKIDWYQDFASSLFSSS
ncbi:MAG: cytidine deaminase [Syntrophomonadaceae bacterium]|nr:cytidine deaminase [Syntrophomonadaceae bacterium]